VANEGVAVTFSNQWDSRKKSINSNHSIHFFIHLILSSCISSLVFVLFLFFVVFLILGINSLNVRRRLIIMILGHSLLVIEIIILIGEGLFEFS
jgi:hypothetical protein